MRSPTRVLRIGPKPYQISVNELRGK